MGSCTHARAWSDAAVQCSHGLSPPAADHSADHSPAQKATESPAPPEPPQCPHVWSATGKLLPTFSFWKTGLCFISTKFRDKVCFSLLQRENRSFSRSFHQLHSILCHNTRAALQTLLCCHPPSTNCSSRSISPSAGTGKRLFQPCASWPSSVKPAHGTFADLSAEGLPQQHTVCSHLCTARVLRLFP